MKTNTPSFIVNENILLAYFSELSKQGKPSCLWTYYSMLRYMLRVRENLDISRYYLYTLLVEFEQY
ncbi:hypothetical protein PPYR_05923 [Photinus pyralis]|uniref:Uncharacterized protein n=1 Tax=Photinus pyralis TaxID=7054 RepID=A0A5N4ASC6_PHOPY|nr:hypothetical protein PPYR_05923 [Photinus pyralis]